MAKNRYDNGISWVREDRVGWDPPPFVKPVVYVSARRWFLLGDEKLSSLKVYASREAAEKDVADANRGTMGEENGHPPFRMYAIAVL